MAILHQCESVFLCRSVRPRKTHKVNWKTLRSQILDVITVIRGTVRKVTQLDGDPTPMMLHVEIHVNIRVKHDDCCFVGLVLG